MKIKRVVLKSIYLHSPSACAWCGRQFSPVQLICVCDENSLPFCDWECFEMWVSSLGENTERGYTKKYFKKFPGGKELERSIYSDIPSACANPDCQIDFRQMDTMFAESKTFTPFCSISCARIWAQRKNISKKIGGREKIFLKKMISASIHKN